MISRPLAHMAWKQYREIRAFWLSIALLVVSAQGLAMLVPTDAARSVIIVWSLSLAAPAFFALGSAGAAFAVEREEGTFDFLRAAPVTTREVLAGKLGVSIVATLVLFVVLWPSALVWTGASLPPPATLHGMLGLWIVAAAEAIAWGTLFSLLTARPLVAICLALVVCSTTTHVLAWGAPQHATLDSEFSRYLWAAPWRLAIVGVVSAADLYLGSGWIGENVEKTAWRIRLRDKRQKAVAAAAASDPVKTMLLEPDRAAQRRRLLWQHWRQSRRLMLLMGFLVVLLATIVIYSGASATPVPIVPMAVLAALGGALVFLPDQEREAWRFFAEHNVPPRSVWLSRQVPWIVTLTLATLVTWLLWIDLGGLVRLLFALAYPPLLPRQRWTLFLPYEFRLPWLSASAACVGVSYAAGQWASMLVRSRIMAGFFAVLLAGILCGWVWIVNTMNLSFIWAVWPLVLALLWATRLRAVDWTEENTSWAARRRAALAVCLPAAALVALVAAVRVYSVPNVSPGFDTAAYVAEITPESIATAEMYRKASELYGDGTKPQAAKLREALALLLEASKREHCTLEDPSHENDSSWLANSWALLGLVISSGDQAASEGKLDEAAERYFSALAIIAQWRQHAPAQFGIFDSARQTERVLANFPVWAAHKGQSAERIVAVGKRLAALPMGVLPVEDELKSNYLLSRAFVQGNPAARATLEGLYAALPSEALWITLLPWERFRELRLLNYRSNTSLERLRNLRAAIERGEPTAYLLPIDEYGFAPRSLEYGAGLGSGYWANRAVQEFAELECHRRAVIVQLALEAFRLEHGKLPESLGELTGHGLAAAPLDPYTGRDFVYFPQGLPAPGTKIEEADLAQAQKTKMAFGPGKPGIWSTGSQLGYQWWREASGWDWADSVSNDQSKQLVYYFRRDQGEGMCRLPTYTAWGLGLWFPIPGQAP